jgi:hypothetical protein
LRSIQNIKIYSVDKKVEFLMLNLVVRKVTTRVLKCKQVS